MSNIRSASLLASSLVLDSSQGKPASGVKVSLQILKAEVLGSSEVTGKMLAEGTTDTDGRCSTLLPPNEKLSPGIYKMVFFTGDYFEAMGTETFYPVVEITFNYADPSQHYHIPLLLSAFSYTTYRGS
ncbi:hydroxyisourate hydrolase [Cryptococcus bacillisporus CA1873]|uniref:5-hydroxyisourate hydrolase n=1 Tax=Cryptococcus bacillisporus CA1873 TaxID=1296111 RepID=A0ABR5B3N7_CRYGA|nr:hydroxyisourate hydrolase [Cryptococcus bacillisporus CA1873]|eukprot:KIR58198.1 hydroxyisourate hydrolase [Cryptococcus gattii CA1873]